MALVKMQDMLHHAYNNKYAVGSFDIVNLDQLQSIMNAAEACRAPVILGLSEPHTDYFDLALLANAVEAASRRSEVPVAIHYDHGSGIEGAVRGINYGCNGVMVDASHRSLEENITITKEVVAMAHTCGIPVEAELGYVPDSGDELVFTTVDEARGFVRLTGVDFLAVSIGTVHGRFSGKPQLDYPRLRHINEALQIPLVLHGSSGLNEDQLRRLIANGIAKVNAFTSITDRAAKLLRKNARAKDEGYLKLFTDVRAEMEEEATRLMRIWGCAGRAAEVFEQCDPWQPAIYEIRFNLPGTDAEEMALITRRGQQALIQIPGVRAIKAGESINSNTAPRYCWQIQLACAEVVEPLKQHPAFINFTRRYLNDDATDRTMAVYKEQA
ncbi:class II fructose-bisphosphate aldolase [Sedimenticola selenatireducens]|uniref:Ketose-bisphosphate aldolase n=1 Tax=Sedimenticola selenatireducens TaxID=191960 RepID=A0A558E0W7_9GAMM|nr:class II fructose-bisphosphate aldolase [Sedimenticola selenatireducens]TVO75153.1 ketose-bisphosphate aldolase [Sedimenticola selenatireducens]TVT66992.1 MAG: ketose-bisphosphate aldolase [Sedimenticola selenatireducens]